MGRFSGASSYGHKVFPTYPGADTFIIAWTVDYYYPTSRLRYPRGFSRVTDERRARRFAKRHGIEFPEVKP